MINTYFDEFATGRLARLPYLGYNILLVVVLIAFVAATVLLMGMAETVMGGELAMAQQKIMGALGMPYMIILGLFLLALVFAGLNVMAKRLRDIGFRGWLTVGLFLLVSVVISQVISQGASSSFSTIVGFALLLVPGDTIKWNNK